MPRYYDGEPGAMSYDRERQPRPEPRLDQNDGPVVVCGYCGRDASGMGSVTVANVGQWCSRDCRNADAGHQVYMAKQRRAG